MMFWRRHSPSRAQLVNALRAMGEEDSAVFVYLRRPEVGTLRKQVSAWEDQYQKKPASLMREYGLGAQILRDLGVQKVKLLTGSKKKLVGLKSFGIEIVDQQPLVNFDKTGAIN